MANTKIQISVEILCRHGSSLTGRNERKPATFIAAHDAFTFAAHEAYTFVAVHEAYTFAVHEAYTFAVHEAYTFAVHEAYTFAVHEAYTFAVHEAYTFAVHEAYTFAVHDAFTFAPLTAVKRARGTRAESHGGGEKYVIGDRVFSCAQRVSGAVVFLVFAGLIIR